MLWGKDFRVVGVTPTKMLIKNYNKVFDMYIVYLGKLYLVQSDYY